MLNDFEILENLVDKPEAKIIIYPNNSINVKISDDYIIMTPASRNRQENIDFLVTSLKEHIENTKEISKF